jgi:hypothetical protein
MIFFVDVAQLKRHSCSDFFFPSVNNQMVGIFLDDMAHLWSPKGRLLSYKEIVLISTDMVSRTKSASHILIGDVFLH